MAHYDNTTGSHAINLTGRLNKLMGSKYGCITTGYTYTESTKHHTVHTFNF